MNTWITIPSPDTVQHSHWFYYSYDMELWKCSCGAFRDRFTGRPMVSVATPQPNATDESRENG